MWCTSKLSVKQVAVAAVIFLLGGQPISMSKQILDLYARVILSLEFRKYTYGSCVLCMYVYAHISIHTEYGQLFTINLCGWMSCHLFLEELSQMFFCKRLVKQEHPSQLIRYPYSRAREGTRESQGGCGIPMCFFCVCCRE